MIISRAVLTGIVLGCWVTSSPGFDGHQVTEGPLTLFIGNVATVTNFDQPQTLELLLTNRSAAILPVQLELRELVDECRAVGETQRQMDVPGGGAAKTSFQFAVGRVGYSAMYPLHVYATFTRGGSETTVHAVRIFPTDFSRVGQPREALDELPLNRVPDFGPLRLAALNTHRVSWHRFDQPLEFLPVGWQGSEEKSRAWLGRGLMARGDTRQALQVHPPYQDGVGTILVEYRLKLPKQAPVQLEFYNAIRDTTPPEPASDGVTFRVWVDQWNPGGSNVPPPARSRTNSDDFGQLVFERHTDSTRWLPGSADLSAWAGQEILLRLEAHPGPQRNPTCDLGFWGDPVVFAGQMPRRITESEKRDQLARARAAIQSGRGDKSTFLFDLRDGMRAALMLGPNGVADGALAFGSGEHTVAFEGLNIALFDEMVGAWPAGVMVRKVAVAGRSSGRLKVTHRCEVNGAAQDVIVEFWSEQSGLRVKVSSPARITDLALGRADQRAARVFYGHGYCVESPQKFRAGGGGHDLSTSHVAVEFDQGLALLTACDSPPDDFEVDPAERVYALHAHPDTTFTFVPSVKGAFDCAFKYRPLYDKRAAPAVAKKAGRFVFDIWGGRYADDARLLRRCFDYGLTNSLVIMHAWQRWGYDYRLPDIFPPHPGLGSLEDMRALGRVCDEAGVLWGLHDNHTDFYPDATGFSYEHIVFDAAGHPRKGWLNEGAGAQAWQFRPDHVRPFLKRNLDLIAPALHPSASFVDVLTSMNAFDYFDRQGQFHSKLETRRCWGENYNLIRNVLGNAPTTSEAGSDQLIGWLDGADCQFLLLAPEYERFQLRAPCRDWERVPWFDAVNHSRFSLHGVGYSDRYQGGRSRADHGIESDDYLSAELLTGHALMVDLPGMPRAAVRKYWLAQDFIESIAQDEIASVEFAGGDIHRQVIGWKSGATVRVNRGTNDWIVAGRTLPPYGYWARNGEIESAVERVGQRVVEQSRAPGKFYVNGRGYNPDAPLAIRPEVERIEPLGGREFRLLVNWQADRPAPKDLAVFYHFTRQMPGFYTDTEFHGGGRPEQPASQWTGRITTGTNWTLRVPEGMPLGEYEIVVGLYDAAGDGRRYRLLGDEDHARRYRVGRLVVEGVAANGTNNVTRIRLRKPASPPPQTVELANAGTPTDFGVARTTGALRIQRKSNQLLLFPLPDGDDFEVGVDLERTAGRPVSPRALHAVDARGNETHPVDFTVEPRGLRFMVSRSDFGYRADLE